MASYADLVLAVSDDFASLTPQDIDRAIERALRHLGELADADRGYVFLASRDGSTVSNTHEWCAEGITPARDDLQDIPLGQFPWGFSPVTAGEETCVPRVADAPDSPEKTEWEREGIQTLFAVPLHARGQPIGFVGCDWVREENPLEIETQQMIRVAAALIASAIERSRAYQALQARSRFEDLLLTISSNFMNLRGHEIARATDDALAELAALVGAQSAYVMRVQEDGRVRPQHVHCIPPLRPPDPAHLRQLAAAKVALWLARFRGGEALVIPSVGDMEADPGGMRRVLQAQGIGAVVEVPMLTAGQLTGYVGFATAAAPRRWTQDEVNQMKLAAQVLESALRRGDADVREALMREQLSRTQKLESVGQLAGGIAHDFNNLLVSVFMSCDLALQILETDPERARAAVSDVRAAAERAASLTKQLLSFSRHKIVRRRAVDINTLIGEMVLMIRRVVPETIELEFLPSSDVPIVYADGGQLEQVVMNLCVNAADAMPRGGRLTLTTSIAQPEAGTRTIAAVARPGRYCRLVVSDTGIGMDEAVQERAFEPFFTTKQPGRGTGLGLSMVYGIIRRHDGYIELRTQKNEGTTVEVWLPLAPATTLDEPTPPGGIDRLDGTETILLAEDDAQVRAHVEQALVSMGYKVLTAADGEQAVLLYERGRVDLVVLDMVMPRMGGIEALRRIRELDPQMRALVCSGYSTEAVPEELLDGPGLRFVAKPYDTVVLLREVRRLLDLPPDSAVRARET